MTHTRSLSTRQRRWTLLSVYLVAGGALYALAATRPAPPTTSPATTRAAFTPAFAAMAYYETSCARCHGPQGSFYGPGLGKGLSDAELKKVIHEMAEGPGAAPLKEDELAVETAYHRALVAGEPFVSVTQAGGGKLAGEVIFEATVTVRVGTAPEKSATVEGSTWSTTIPPDASLNDITITAEFKGKKTAVSLGNSAYSHAKPLAPPPGG